LRLGLSADYEVDLWGRLNARTDAERFRAQATVTDFQAAALSLSAEVVRAWYQLLTVANQRTLLQEQLDTNEDILRLLENRFGGGQVRSVDILRQRQLVAANRQQLILLDSDLEVLEHQLSVLMGQPPQQALQYELDSLPALPGLPGTGIETELVQRRPDVRAALLRLSAADRDLAASISNLYPGLP